MKMLIEDLQANGKISFTRNGGGQFGLKIPSESRLKDGKRYFWTGYGFLDEKILSDGTLKIRQASETAEHDWTLFTTNLDGSKNKYCLTDLELTFLRDWQKNPQDKIDIMFIVYPNLKKKKVVGIKRYKNMDDYLNREAVRCGMDKKDPMDIFQMVNAVKSAIENSRYNLADFKNGFRELIFSDDTTEFKK